MRVFSRWKPSPRPSLSQHVEEDLLPEELPPQSHATQCDEMGVLAEGGGAIITVMAAGGFHASDTERTVYCRLRLGHHEAQTGSLPSHPPEAAKDAPPPVCLFEQTPGTALVLLDCFAKGERSDSFTPVGPKNPLLVVS